MKAGAEIIAAGKDHVDMLPLFRSLVVRSGAKKGDSLIWAGCEGPCYSMATFFSFGLRSLGLKLFFVTDADINRLWRLEFQRDLGFVAIREKSPLKAKVLVLMSGLVQVPFENVLRLTQESLREGGVIIGETVVRGLFKQERWDERIPIRYLFEFSMERPTALAMKREC